MATDPVLRMLGLARRARQAGLRRRAGARACFDHKTRCVFIAGGAERKCSEKAAFLRR
ncbi:MAG: hypothetical protein ACLR4Z_15560 [Butyricicoccaceae bacterium]